MVNEDGKKFIILQVIVTANLIFHAIYFLYEHSLIVKMYMEER